MRQLKGKPKKETSKDKKERKQAMQEARQQVATVVLPTVAVVVLLIVLFVYVATRPEAVEWKNTMELMRTMKVTDIRPSSFLGLKQIIPIIYASSNELLWIFKISILLDLR